MVHTAAPFLFPVFKCSSFFQNLCGLLLFHSCFTPIKPPCLSKEIAILSTKIAVLCDLMHLLARNKTKLFNLFVVKCCN